MNSVSLENGCVNSNTSDNLRFYECGPMKQIKAMMKRIDAAVPLLIVRHPQLFFLTNRSQLIQIGDTLAAVLICGSLTGNACHI